MVLTLTAKKTIDFCHSHIICFWLLFIYCRRDNLQISKRFFDNIEMMVNCNEYLITKGQSKMFTNVHREMYAYSYLHLNSSKEDVLKNNVDIIGLRAAKLLCIDN